MNSLKHKKGKGAIVVPTGFLTAASGIEKKIRQKLVEEKIIYGVVSMPSNVFATTGTNVSVLFFDNACNHDRVILIDASKLGEKYKDGKNQRCRLRDFEIKQIIETFNSSSLIEDFSVMPSYDDIKNKGYSFSAGQYFDVKIELVNITQEEFESKMAKHKANLSKYLDEGNKLGKEIKNRLEDIKYEND